MHIIPFLERGHSGTNDVNLLFNDGSCYLMDNHLAATWCWLQKINTTKQYNLLHIDRHYDLLNSQTEWWMQDLRAHNVDLANISFDNYRRLTYQTRFGAPNQLFKIFRWDNYLTIFNQLYPNLIQTALFATHKDGGIIEELDISEKEPWDLHGNLSYWMTYSDTRKWIVNIDIDYFFTDDEGRYFQFFSDEFVTQVADEIQKVSKNIEVVTIALSPEMCGGWNRAERIARIFMDKLQIPSYGEPMV